MDPEQRHIEYDSTQCILEDDPVQELPDIEVQASPMLVANNSMPLATEQCSIPLNEVGHRKRRRLTNTAAEDKSSDFIEMHGVQSDIKNHLQELVSTQQDIANILEKNLETQILLVDSHNKLLEANLRIAECLEKFLASKK